ncbi:MAG: FAD-binding oxidoreductase [Candidatus Zixiibacteriota bacterium]
MIISDIKNKFIKILGESNVVDDYDIICGYSQDETPDISCLPELVLRPQDTEQISSIMKICDKYNIAITIRGGGTSVVGGSVPASDSIVISLEHLDSIIEIDPETMTAVLQPRVITGDINKAAAEYGLFYPVDPASMDSCTIGGNISTSAGGMKAVKYGTTKDYVMGLTMVLADGSIIKTGGKIKKNAAGYNLAGILVGSEGTLAIITEIILKLKPKPNFFVSLLVGFDSIQIAARAVSELLKSGYLPCSIEFYDRQIIDIIKKTSNHDVPLDDMGAHLIVQFDSRDQEALDKEYFEAGKFLMEKGAKDIRVASQRPIEEKLWSIRRGIRDSVREISPTIIAEDVAVPINKISDLVKRIEEISRKWQVQIVTFGHAGDGNAHIDIMKGDIPDDIWNNKIDSIVKDIIRTAIELGGTISGEHGIGITKNRYLKMQFSNAELELMRKIKKAFDPKGLLNPGKAL